MSTIKAVVGGNVIAEASENEVLVIEGSIYFPPQSIDEGVLAPNDTPYLCPWKGASQYYDLTADGGQQRDAAWSYPDPFPSAIRLVGYDFGGYIAFDTAVVALRQLEDWPSDPCSADKPSSSPTDHAASDVEAHPRHDRR